MDHMDRSGAPKTVSDSVFTKRVLDPDLDRGQWGLGF